MKQLMILSFLLILTACTQYSTISSEQSVISAEPKIQDVKTEETQVQINEEEQVQKETEEETTEENAEVDEQKPQTLSSGNMTFSSSDENDLYLVKGKIHTIEVVDVTKDQEFCMVKVDGITDLIKLDETKEINGVKITVLEVYAMKSLLEDNDICQLMIR